MKRLGVYAQESEYQVWGDRVLSEGKTGKTELRAIWRGCMEPSAVETS